MSETHAVLAARELLESLTPLKTDCGRLCQGACCQGDEATGMLLFPGEEALYADCTFARVVPTGFSLGGPPAQLLVCDGRCDRKNRPLAWRMDARARAVCPLTDYGMKALDPEFRQAVRRAYDLLLEDEVCAAYLRALDEAFTL